MTYAKAPSISPGWGSRRKRKLFGAIPTVKQERAMRAAYSRAAAKHSASKETTSAAPKRQSLLNRVTTRISNLLK